MSVSNVAYEQSCKAVKQIILCTAAGVLLSPLLAHAQTVQPRMVHIVEWDLPAEADASPGAMVVDTRGEDNNRLWFVTRLGAPQRAFRLDPSRSLMKGSAQWTSWELSDSMTPPAFVTGGLKKIKASHDRRFVFVRTSASLVRIDTQNCSGSTPTCERTRWVDRDATDNPLVSDLAVDDWNNVFTTNVLTPSDPTAGYVQMLTPGPAPASGTGTATVTRWNVGGGVGVCPTAAASSPCISGIAAHPNNRYLVYYSEPGIDGCMPAPGVNCGNNIAELNISTTGTNIKRWPLDAVGASEPRQLNIDKWGIVWVVTGSGHLVNLDPVRNRMASHAIPLGGANDPFGVAPDDDVVGYTSTGLNKVGMLIPKRGNVPVTPVLARVEPMPFTVDVFKEQAVVDSGAVPPEGKVVQGFITTNPDGDVFVEAQIDTMNDSSSPLGITANRGKGQGTFFYAVGTNTSMTTNSQNQVVAVDRVGFVRLPKPQKVKHPRDDDDAEDGWDHNSHPNGWHDSATDDDDDDGLENAYDSPSARENVQVVDNAPAIGPMQSADFPVTTSATSLALIGVVTADDLLAQIGVEIYNAAGLLVGTSAPSIAGVAAATVALPAPGTYKVRIRNYGATTVTHTPKLIVREPPLP